MKQAMRRRKEWFRQPAELGRDQFPSAEPDAQRDEPGTVVDQVFDPKPAQPVDDEGEHHEQRRPDQQQADEDVAASPRNDVRKASL